MNMRGSWKAHPTTFLDTHPQRKTHDLYAYTRKVRAYECACADAYCNAYDIKRTHKQTKHPIHVIFPTIAYSVRVGSALLPCRCVKGREKFFPLLKCTHKISRFY